jgi:hypothetical protein
LGRLLLDRSLLNNCHVCRPLRKRSFSHLADNA